MSANVKADYVTVQTREEADAAYCETTGRFISAQSLIGYCMRHQHRITWLKRQNVDSRMKLSGSVESGRSAALGAGDKLDYAQLAVVGYIEQIKRTALTGPEMSAMTEVIREAMSEQKKADLAAIDSKVERWFFHGDYVIQLNDARRAIEAAEVK